MDGGVNRITGRRGFTLIELMLVFTIMIVLAGLLFTGVRLAQQRAAKSRARAEVRELAKAWKSYWMIYQEWPSGFAGTVQEMTAPVMDILQGNNPQGLVFMDVGSAAGAAGGFQDPWRKLYRVDFSRTTSGQYEYYKTTVSFPNRNRYLDDIQ